MKKKKDKKQKGIIEVDECSHDWDLERDDYDSSGSLLRRVVCTKCGVKAVETYHFMSCEILNDDGSVKSRYY